MLTTRGAFALAAGVGFLLFLSREAREPPAESLIVIGSALTLFLARRNPRP